MSQLEGCGGSLHQFEMKAARLAALFRPDMDIAKVVSNIVTSQDFTASDGRVEAEMVRNSEVLERVRRDGGYGHHGHCSQPFVIFPFLIFLQSLATTVVNVININNNNNNNNNNQVNINVQSNNKIVSNTNVNDGNHVNVMVS